jgi:hypothetical protein
MACPPPRSKANSARIALRREELEALLAGTRKSRCCCIRIWRRITAIGSNLAQVLNRVENWGEAADICARSLIGSN